MLLPGEGHLDVSEPQAGQRGGRQGELREDPRAVSCVCPPSPPAYSMTQGCSLHIWASLGRSEAGLRGKDQFGTWPNRLGPGSERSTPHTPPSLHLGGERAPMLGETVGHFLCRERI